MTKRWHQACHAEMSEHIRDCVLHVNECADCRSILFMLADKCLVCGVDLPIGWMDYCRQCSLSARPLWD